MSNTVKNDATVKSKHLESSVMFQTTLFMVFLCLALIVSNYIILRKTIEQRTQAQMADILHFVDSHIDDEDLIRCIETGEESETYKKTLRLMDEMMNDFSIHYLYAIKPLNLNETGNVMSVFCAENDYQRYVDTEGNLYLGWISEDDYSVRTVKKLFSIMEQDDIVYFIESTSWSTDYTGALPLKDASGEAYALLCVDVEITTLLAELLSRSAINVLLVLVLGMIYILALLGWTRDKVTVPLSQLEQAVSDFVSHSHGQRSIEALRFDAPTLKENNEIQSLSSAITRMTEDMQDYVSHVLSAEEESRNMKNLADTMVELAVIDSLTGVKNKMAFAYESGLLEKELAENKGLRFGVVMIDLNCLKPINDNYGHAKGDVAIRTLAKIAGDVFRNSQVFRVGGDEFAVLLRGQDYENIDALIEQFLSLTADRPEKEPWECACASIGFARYDPKTDLSVNDVYKRADKAMYQMKKRMKAARHESRIAQ